MSSKPNPLENPLEKVVFPEPKSPLNSIIDPYATEQAKFFAKFNVSSDEVDLNDFVDCILDVIYKYKEKINTGNVLLSHTSLPCSTIGAIELNFRVRDGNGCGLYAIVTGKLSGNLIAILSEY